MDSSKLDFVKSYKYILRNKFFFMMTYLLNSLFITTFLLGTIIILIKIFEYAQPILIFLEENLTDIPSAMSNNFYDSMIKYGNLNHNLFMIALLILLIFVVFGVLFLIFHSVIFYRFFRRTSEQKPKGLKYFLNFSVIFSILYFVLLLLSYLFLTYVMSDSVLGIFISNTPLMFIFFVFVFVYVFFSYVLLSLVDDGKMFSVFKRLTLKNLGISSIFYVIFAIEVLVLCLITRAMFLADLIYSSIFIFALFFVFFYTVFLFNIKFK